METASVASPTHISLFFFFSWPEKKVEVYVWESHKEEGQVLCKNDEGWLVGGKERRRKERKKKASLLWLGSCLLAVQMERKKFFSSSSLPTFFPPLQADMTM